MAVTPSFDPLEIRQFGLITLATLLGGVLAWCFRPDALPLHTLLPPAKVELEVATDAFGNRYGVVVGEYGPWAPRNVILNTADAEALLVIPGIGSSTAARILRERQRGGPFIDWQDLGRRVPGIGPARIADLQKLGVRLQASESVEP